MVRITIKGGVWKNTEDEILKAAVMKYGKNQWARISSLLVRKTPKQCKARWYEWLDPSIKKTEWTREEEEKLLHLAKIMPTQWRTIAPIIGRTPAQCLEHYEKLLDAAQEKESGIENPDDPRRLRPGEIDPNPEAKPARPDPVDMDEDEKEMLSEARARLANTKGKKAKRKMREKQLEEARRLASLQKKRELAAAGIVIERQQKRRKKRRVLDYGKEVPFEKRPQAGFFDTADEKKKSIEMKKKTEDFIGVDLADLDGRKRAKLEEEARKRDAKRQKIMKADNLPEVLQKINQLNDPIQLLRRKALNLPEPQVSDAELEELAKMNEQSLVPTTPMLDGPEATRSLLANFGQTPARAQTPMRTPARTPVQRDTIRLEAQNLLAMNRQETPLKGGENVVLHASDYSSVTPRQKTAATPNVLATPLRGGPGSGSGAADGSATPGGATPAALRRKFGQTPMRDDLHINQASMSSEQAEFANAARSEKSRQALARKKVKAGLASLPQPEYEVDIVLPDVAEDMVDDKRGSMMTDEDAEDAKLRSDAEAKAKMDAKLRARSLAVQRNLPRPVTVNTQPEPVQGNLWTGPASDPMSRVVAELLQSEMTSLMRHDNAKYPPPGSKRPAKSQIPHIDQFSEAELDGARAMIDAEFRAGPNPDETPQQIHRDAWTRVADDLVFLPGLKTFGAASEASKADQLQAAKQQLEITKEYVRQEEENADKLENKVNILTGGYSQRSKTLLGEISDLYYQLTTAQTEFKCFKMLQTQEAVALPARIESARQEVNAQAELETRLQKKYAEYMAEKERLTQLAIQMQSGR